MANQAGVKIAYQTERCTATWSSPYIDASIEDILEGFFGLCVAHGWQPITVVQGMEDFANSHQYMLSEEK